VTFAPIHLTPRLPEFLARHPELEMEVVLDDRNIDLVQEGIDVALRRGEPHPSIAIIRPSPASRPVLVGEVRLGSLPTLASS